MSYNVAILDAAERHLGLDEWPGSRHNPQILRMFEDVGHGWVQDDETPWCAAYVGAVLAEVGLPHTGKLNARSYTKWGQPVELRDARPGDIVVLWRNSPDSWQGHVAFLVRFDGSNVILRGGNQGNSVTDAPYPVSRIVAIRRADGGADADNRPVLRVGSPNRRLVKDVQIVLKDLGYQPGAIDGIFGANTKAAVLAFQGENGLQTDGIVGRNTWRALESAKPRPLRTKSTKGLREAGSRTIAAADKTQAAQAGMGAIALGSGAVATLEAQVRATQEGLEELSATVGVTGPLDAAMPYILAGLSIAALGLAAWSWWQAQKVKAARTEDAQTGAHMGR